MANKDAFQLTGSGPLSSKLKCPSLS